MVFAFVVSLVAGLSTCVGGLLSVQHRVRERSVLALALAFAAGMMLTISLGQIVPGAIGALRQNFSLPMTLGMTGATIACGFMLFHGVDALLPHTLNPAHLAGAEDRGDPLPSAETARIARSGLLVAIVLTAHNLPEGLASFLATLQDPVGGMKLAFAIAIHNIPEGIAVAAPIFAATGNAVRALLWATVSGLAEPVGGLLGYLLLAALLPEHMIVLGLVLVAGMMLTLALRELLPAASRHRTAPWQVHIGLGVGASVMALTIWLLA